MVARRPVGKRSVDDDGTVRVRGRAANGEGSVYFAADGRWRATYRIPGEGRPRSVSGATRDKAIAARDRRLAQLAEEPLSPIAAAGAMSGSTTIGELANWWLNNVQRHQVRATTWAQAEDRVRRIEDTLGTVPVAKLKVEQVIAWQGTLLETLAPKTVGHHRQTLAQVLDQAVELGLISTNVVRRVKAPKVPATQAAVPVHYRDPGPGRRRPHRPVRGGGGVVVLPGVAGQRSPRPRLGGRRSRHRDGPSPASLCLREPSGRPARTDQDRRGHGHPPTRPHRGRAAPSPSRHPEHSTTRLGRSRGPNTPTRARSVHPVFTTPDGRLVLRQSVTKSLTHAPRDRRHRHRRTRHPHRPPLGRHRPVRRGRRIHRRDRPIHRPRLAASPPPATSATSAPDPPPSPPEPPNSSTPPPRRPDRLASPRAKSRRKAETDGEPCCSEKAQLLRRGGRGATREVRLGGLDDELGISLWIDGDRLQLLELGLTGEERGTVGGARGAAGVPLPVAEEAPLWPCPSPPA